jgi:hypothetical protein
MLHGALILIQFSFAYCYIKYKKWIVNQSLIYIHLFCYQVNLQKKIVCKTFIRDFKAHLHTWQEKSNDQSVSGWSDDLEKIAHFFEK